MDIEASASAASAASGAYRNPRAEHWEVSGHTEIWESTVLAKSLPSAKSGLEATAIMSSCCVAYNSYRQQEANAEGLTSTTTETTQSKVRSGDFNAPNCFSFHQKADGIAIGKSNRTHIKELNLAAQN